MKKKGFLKDKRIESAIRKVPRHLFVPDEPKESAYKDKPLPTKRMQTISQPSVVARMLEWLDIKEGNKVLEVGTGSGWQSAIIATLVGNATVYSIERIPELVEFAKRNLSKAKIKNIEIFERDGSQGLKEKAPFDRIIVSAACDKVPQQLIEQLASDGLLVAPVGIGVQSMVLLKKTHEGVVEKKREFGYRFAPLVIISNINRFSN